MPRKPAEKQLSRRVLVNIDQDLTTKTSKVIWEHEIPLLEQVHGDGKITIQEPTVLDEGYADKPSRAMLPYPPQGAPQDHIPRPSQSARIGWVFTGDPDEEYERLKAVYGLKHDEETDRNMSVVFLAYGRPQENKLADMLGAPTLKDMPDEQLTHILHNNGHAVPEGASREELMALAEEAGAELV